MTSSICSLSGMLLEVTGAPERSGTKLRMIDCWGQYKDRIACGLGMATGEDVNLSGCLRCSALHFCCSHLLVLAFIREINSRLQT